MGIVLKHHETNMIVFYLKGAETVMKNKVRPNQRATVDESCENLALEGLRTLVISQKHITQEFYDDWNKTYQHAKANLNNREELVAKCVNNLEQDMELLAITGVEGKFCQVCSLSNVLLIFYTICRRMWQRQLKL